MSSYSRVLRGLGVSFAVCASGCSGNSAGSGSAGTVCSQIALAAPTLVSPANGTAGVSDTVGSIALTMAIGGETISLVSAASTIVVGTVAGSGGTSQTLTLPALAPQTTYTVRVANIPTACAGRTESIGAFTTQ